MATTASPPSRKSILAGMALPSDRSDTSPDALNSNRFVSNTDAVLRQQRPADGRAHSRNTSVSSKRTTQTQPGRTSISNIEPGAAIAKNGPISGSTILGSSREAGPDDSLTSNGELLSAAPAKENSGNRMSRLIRRATSRDEQQANGKSNLLSAQPADATDNASIKSKSSFRRLSLRFPKFGNGQDSDRSSRRASVVSVANGGGGAFAAEDERAERKTARSRVQAEDEGAVPPIPQQYRQQASPPQASGAAFAGRNGSAAAASSPPAPQRQQSRPESPTRPLRSPDRESPVDFGRTARSPPPPQQANGGGSEETGYLGKATGALAGVAAAGAGAAAAVAGTVAGALTGGRRGGDEEEEDDEDFHDANDVNELSNISEGTEVDDHGRKHTHPPPTNQQLEAQRLRADQEAHGASGRHRGLSAPPFAHPPATHDEEETTINTTSPRNSMHSTNTAGVASSITTAQNGGEAQMSRETPEYVREKAAAVAKLRFDDCKQSAESLVEDIGVARHALNLFLNSKMLEAESIVKKYADQRLYYALGAALIAVIKGFMTFEPEDLATAISFCKDTIHIAQLLRKPTNSVANFGRFVRGTGQSPSAMHGMTLVQRHAELIYAEASLLKAVMGILYSGDFFGFVAEALNMRNAYGIYRSLSKYVEWADEQAAKKHGKGAIDESIDEDFRSGVYLGSGLISMILGLLPGKVLKIMEVFGYGGDCVEGLKILCKSGEWSPNPKHLKPGMPMEEEGIRRQLCDMAILLYHLVISTFMPVNGVNIPMADKVLHYNLERYPEGIFFLYFSGRLYSSQSLAERAITQFMKARDVQREYVQLQHICYWDMTLCHMSLGQWKEAHDCFDVLLNDSNWSKAVYNYGKAANLYQTGGDTPSKEAGRLIVKTPSLMQRIAGKSIPLEKFVARKANKFQEQGRLLLPALEFSYFFHCVSTAPRYILADEHLVAVSTELKQIQDHESDPSSYHSGEDEFWDDFCLAHFLRAVTLKYIAHPEKHAKARPKESPIPANEAEDQAEMSLKTVIENREKITGDHYLIYFAHYELGRLYAAMGRTDEAREEFKIVLSGKNLGDKGRKGKYSMQNMCLLRSNGALDGLS